MFNVYETIAQELANTSDLEDLRIKFHAAMSAFDLDQYTYQIVQHNFLHNMQNFFVTTYPKEWEKHYLEQNYFESDALVNKFLTTGHAFVYDEQTYKDSPDKGKLMINEAKTFNLQHGIGIPIPGPNGAFSILTLGSKSLTGNEINDLHHYFYKDLMICGLMFHGSFLSLNLENQLYPRHDLTTKELEALKWICAGKSNTDMAAILGISLEGVKHRNSQVFKKLNVSTRFEAIAKAYRFKIIS